CAATINSILAQSQSRSSAGSRTIISGSISECVIILSGQGAGLFLTFRADLVWDGSTAIQKFPVVKVRILRLTFYRQPGFPTLWTITGRSAWEHCISIRSEERRVGKECRYRW